MRTARHAWCLVTLLCVASGAATGQSGGDPGATIGAEDREPTPPTFAELKASGALRSSYRRYEPRRVAETAPAPDLLTFRSRIRPILEEACFSCHGPDKQKGHLRIDTLDPDLFGGSDVDWWLDVLSVLTNGEMPPEDEVDLASDDRAQVIEWLAAESQSASAARRATKEHSSFRRMTRYEYGYALQDLLGLPYDFGGDLPPDPTSEDGFQNSSEVLHLTGIQFRAYLDAGRKALELATVTGERPAPLFWSVSMAAAAAVEWARQDAQLANVRKEHDGDPEKLQAELQRLAAEFRARPGGAHYADPSTGRRARQSWGYDGAKYAWRPTDSRPEVPEVTDQIAVIPAGDGLIVELGDRLRADGTLRVRVRASRASADDGRTSSLRLMFGWQASNDSQAVVRLGEQDVVVDAAPGAPRFYQWDVPLSQIYPRNLVRNVTQLGDLPSPSEYLKLVNASVSGGDIHVDHVEVTAPVYERWPPASHTRIFGDRGDATDEAAHAREVLTSFMSRAWRREPSAAEVEQKLRLFDGIRPTCDGFQEAMIEVLATVLSSPHFLYLVESGPASDEIDGQAGARLPDLELATRLSMFLWCSTPDEELRSLAEAGRLQDSEVLSGQVGRMLQDPRSRRFAEHFVDQWLGLELLDFLHVDRKAYPRFDAALQEAMREEPVAFFQEVLAHDRSALEFIHADFTMADERLAQHYGLDGVAGNHFRRVELGPLPHRGGLLTQAGLLAMNSDGKDSHPLKRGIWMLQRLLDDPPPPPPAAVPQIDLADPEIAKLTLKQRIENHRDSPACMSCHAKIDPWGIAFENFDAAGSWRTEVQGRPIDSVGVLFNKQEIDGIDGLKRFLLEHRQDQFVRALAHKLVTFALGRPLAFGDRAAVDEITALTRRRGDGLATMVTAIATSELFRSK